MTGVTLTNVDEDGYAMVMENRALPGWQVQRGDLVYMDGTDRMVSERVPHLDIDGQPTDTATLINPHGIRRTVHNTRRVNVKRWTRRYHG